MTQVESTLPDAFLGTITGDPIEAKAISNLFGQGKAAAVPVLVGSIKTNLGHLEAVSGLAGVMKAVLAIEKGLIPPNLNFERPNPAIDMKAWNVMVSRSVWDVLFRSLSDLGPYQTDCLA